MEGRFFFLNNILCKTPDNTGEIQLSNIFSGCDAEHQVVRVGGESTDDGGVGTDPAIAFDSECDVFHHFGVLSDGVLCDVQHGTLTDFTSSRLVRVLGETEERCRSSNMAAYEQGRFASIQAEGTTTLLSSIEPTLNEAPVVPTLHQYPTVRLEGNGIHTLLAHREHQMDFKLSPHFKSGEGTKKTRQMWRLAEKERCRLKQKRTEKAGHFNTFGRVAVRAGKKISPAEVDALWAAALRPPVIGYHGTTMKLLYAAEKKEARRLQLCNGPDPDEVVLHSLIIPPPRMGFRQKQYWIFNLYYNLLQVEKETVNGETVFRLPPYDDAFFESVYQRMYASVKASRTVSRRGPDCGLAWGYFFNQDYQRFSIFLQRLTVHICSKAPSNT
ncbi:hypothetical protein ADEAN_000299400 [Angomonas deanei]|uniref:Uncharacterized protein n=1 Tax=Angomonas deanei TaxID=59799 RepID=A0A7G2C7I2_9TRYP|nr:hypothetical protein ADEAN_000299400 [Angomonas deanei]